MSECPRGLINDPYPGECGRYVDLDNNNLCDLSEETTEPINSVTPTKEPEFSLPLLPILFIVPIVLYFLTNKYKNWWNVALIISFIPTLLSSLGYIFKIGGELSYNLHLYFGTVFVSVGLCHTLWHWRYYLAMIKNVRIVSSETVDKKY